MQAKLVILKECFSNCNHMMTLKGRTLKKSCFVYEPKRKVNDLRWKKKFQNLTK